MQWDGGANAGFSCASPDLLYIPQDPSPDRPTVESQKDDPSSLLSEVRRLTALRLSLPQLQSNGPVEFICDGYPLVYRRGDILAVINPSDNEASCDTGLTDAEILYTCGGKPVFSGGRVSAPPVSAAFIRIEKRRRS